jgi:acid stress-induced BolA-like protein IbaG/YrbA
MEIEQVKSLISSNLPDAQIFIKDPYNDGEHLEAIVIDESFEGLSMVNQQRKVMSALKENFATDLHALALKTFAPSKWESAKHQFNL